MGDANIIENEAAGLQVIGDAASGVVDYVSNSSGSEILSDVGDFVSSPDFFGSTALSALLGGADKLGKLSPVTKAADDVPTPKVGSEGGPGAGKQFSQKTKDAARAESNDTCVFCGTETNRTPGATQSNIDHAIPKSRGGNNTLDNAQNTCRTCNQQKGTKTTEEFEKTRNGGN